MPASPVHAAGSMSDRPRVLLIAEAANPEWVSVPLVGWSLAQALRAVADVHLVTQIRNREAILRAGLVEGRDFTAIDSEALARPVWKLGEWLRMGEGKGWTMLQALNAISYPHFERLVWRAFGPRLAAGAFDLVHRVTPLSPTIASPIAAKVRRLGVPFVLGPLNGGVPWPPGFDAERRREREWLSYVRGAYQLLPGRAATLAADAVIVGSRHTESELPARARARCVYIPENSVDPACFSRRAAHRPGPLRACFIGRMVPYKGPDMLIEAAAPLLRDGQMTLDMVGDGSMLAALRAQAAEAGVSHAVRFHGWLGHGAVQDVAAECTALTFPSIREFGGGVVLEAMALGLAPLVVDYGGPGELVSDGAGFKVALGRRPQIVAAFRAALARLAADPQAVARAGAAARARVQASFTWERKAEQVAGVYDSVLRARAAEGRPRPSRACRRLAP
jgi:glycosyltransferase involved in cell wall biosynthesis